MSDSSPSHQPLQQQETHEPDVVRDDSLPANQETPNQAHPPLNKSLPETICPPNPEDNNPEEEEEDDDDDDDEEGQQVEEAQEQEHPPISSGMPLPIDPPITDTHVSVRDVTLTSPSPDPNTRTRAMKRKKGKGKGKSKRNIKKRQATEEKMQTLLTKLNPIPFIPHKILDFSKHEKLFRKLGLWDFVHIDLDRNLRADLIAQLVATYQPKLRASYVNDVRIMVNRADLARAFWLPLKKEKGNVGGSEVDLGWEAFSEDTIGFMGDFLSDWVLVHADMWMMPKEIMDWMNVIKDGHPEKVDWAGLFWFMVERELKQGSQLRDSYYASHLQHLVKFQHPELFLTEEHAAAEEEDGADAELVGKINVECPGEEEPSTKLTLGNDNGEKEDGINGVEMMDVEKCSHSYEEEEQQHWFLHGKNSLGEHFMQRCGAENATGVFGRSEYKKDEEEDEMDGEEDEEEAAGNSFHVLANDDGLERDDGFTGNLLQAMEGNQMAFGLQDVRSDDMQHLASTPSFFNKTGKKVIEHNDNMSRHSIIEANKRLKINDPWDNKPVDFAMCIGRIQKITERARVFYEEKEQALAHSNVNQQILLSELQKRDAVIDHLHKSKMDEIHNKDGEIFRLERELYLMGSVLNGYRKTLKGANKAFADYRERARLPEESTYKDAAGSGGHMLTAVELEKHHKKQEEEYKAQCMILELSNKAEEYICRLFDEHIEKINLLEERLTGLETNAKELIESYANPQVPKTEEQVPVAAESQPIPQADDKVPEAGEPLTVAETNEQVAADP